MKRRTYIAEVRLQRQPFLFRQSSGLRRRPCVSLRHITMRTRSRTSPVMRAFSSRAGIDVDIQLIPNTQLALQAVTAGFARRCGGGRRADRQRRQ